MGVGQAGGVQGSPWAQPTRAATCSQHQPQASSTSRWTYCNAVTSAGLPTGFPAYQTPKLVCLVAIWGQDVGA